MAQQIVNCGTYAMDATGDYARDAFIKAKANIAELFALAGLSGPLTAGINVGPTPNCSPPGTPGPVCFELINLDFTTLYTAAGQPGLQEFILMGGEPGMIIGTGNQLGTGDPARTAWLKFNANCTALYALL